MFNRNVSLAACVFIAASMVAFGQPGAGFLFQLPGSSSANLFGYGYSANPFTPVINTLGPAGAFQITPTVDGSKYYVLGTTLQIANPGFTAFTTISGIVGAPTAVTASPDGKYVVVGAGDLYVLDAGSNQILLDTTVGGTIVGIAISRDSKYAYALSNLPYGSQVTQIDLVAKAKVGSPIQLTGGATWIGFSPLNLLYATAINRIFEIDPSTFNFTSTGTIQINAQPKSLHFTPDGTAAYGVNLTSNITGGSLLQLTLATHTIAAWPASTGTAPTPLDDVLVAGNGQIFTYSSAAGALFDVTPSPLGVAASALDTLISSAASGSQAVVGATISNELPSARYLYALVQSGAQDYLLRINLATKTLDAQTSASINGGILQFVAVPPQTGAASFIQYNNPQTVQAGATSAPLIVRVLDTTGRPMYNVPVSFTTDPTTGLTIATPGPTTNAEGWAQTTIVAPAVGGAYTVGVTAGTANTTFTINVPGTGTGGGTGPTGVIQVTKVWGDGQIFYGTNSGAAQQLLTVLVVDTTGKPIQNVAVSFTITQGTGNVQNCIIDVNGQPFCSGQASSNTDANGHAIAIFQPAVPANNQYFETDTVTANAGNYGSVVFYETEVATTVPLELNTVAAYPTEIILSPTVDQNFTINAPAGSVLQNGFTAQIISGVVPQLNTPIQNVGLSIVTSNTDFTPSKYASCQGSSLSDQNGVAHCNVLAACQTGIFPIGLQIGGDHIFLGKINITTGSGQVIAITSGNNQTIGSGQQGAALVATVTDGCGTPVSGASVTWTILSGSATLSSTVNTSNSQGQVSTKITMGQTPGPVQVRVSLGTASTVTFQLTNQAVGAAMSIVSGNNQSAQVGQAFAQPLTVIVTNGQGSPVSGVPVSFSVTGNATINPASATTDSQGHASTTATAGSSAGTAQVTATYANFTSTFSLTVTPKGPSVSASGFANAASFAPGLVPCGLATMTGSNIAPGISGTIFGSQFFGPLPYSLSGLSISVNGSAAPMYSLSNINGAQQATFQTPCEISPTTNGTVVVTLNGASTTVTSVPIYAGQPGIFTYAGANGKPYGEVIRAADSSYVTASNPLHRGETYYIVATGLGQVTPATSTDASGVAGQTVNLPILVGVNNGGVPLISTQYFSGAIGLYLIGFQVPTTAQAGTDQPLALAVTINGQLVFGNTAYIPVVQ